MDYVFTVDGVKEIEQDWRVSGVRGFMYMYAYAGMTVAVDENAYVKFSDCLLGGFFGEEILMEMYGLGNEAFVYVTITFVDEIVHV